MIVYMNLIIGLLSMSVGFIVVETNLGYFEFFIDNEKYDTKQVKGIIGNNLIIFSSILLILSGINIFNKSITITSCWIIVISIPILLINIFRNIKI